MQDTNSARAAFVQITSTANWLQSTMTDILEPFDLSVQQLRTLAIVAEYGDDDATVNEIRNRMYDPMSNVSRLLNKLVQKGLIRKVRGEDDQRIVRVQLTENGRRLLDLGQGALESGMAKLANLSDEQFRQLSGLLSELRQQSQRKNG